MGDNCFETDGGARNIRVFRNRCFDSASGALSVQPMFGGPVYFYQNLIYNAPTGSLKYIEGSSGILTYNNTIIGEGRAGPASNQHYRNNLFLAQGRFRSGVRDHHLHQLFELRLQRLPAQSRQRRFVRVELARRSVSRPLSARLRSSAAMRPCGITAKPPARINTAYWWITTFSSAFPNPTRAIRSASTLRTVSILACGPVQPHRRRGGAADHHRWIHRPGARPGRLRTRARSVPLRPAITNAR